MPVTIYHQKNISFNKSSLKRCLEELLIYSGRKNAILEVSLVGSKKIAALNETFRKKKGVTDVLSFPLDKGAKSATVLWPLGEVVIAVSVARQQAKKAHRQLIQQLVRLAVHGLVHLTGLDHEASKVMKNRFEALETKYLHHLTKKGLNRWDGLLQL
jgi:rRNA maturation RNase YbeY